MSVMVDFWWKVILAGLVTAGLAKLLGSSLGFWALFLIAWIGWTVVLLGLVRLAAWWWSRPRKGGTQEPPGGGIS